MYFVSISCPKQGLKIEGVVLHRVEFLEYYCPKQGQDYKHSAANLILRDGSSNVYTKPPKY